MLSAAASRASACASRLSGLKSRLDMLLSSLFVLEFFHSGQQRIILCRSLIRFTVDHIYVIRQSLLRVLCGYRLLTDGGETIDLLPGKFLSQR